MQVSIRGLSYDFYPDALSRQDTRDSYFRLAKSVFNLEFDKWYTSGFWDDKFIPYVLYDKNVAVSSVAVCVNDVSWKRTVKRYVQISTVMTLPSYRKRGLNRWLMDHVLNVWQDQCDAFYLLGNDSVVEYYPRFGFEEFTEYDFTVPVQKTQGKCRKLDLGINADFDLLIRKYKTSNPFAELKVDNIGQFVFHCMQFLSDHIFYLECYDAVVIAEHNGKKMTCYDVLVDCGCPLGEILGAVADGNTECVQLGFTPLSVENCSIMPSREEDNHLFVRSGPENIFRDHKVLFPLLSRA